MVGDAQLAAQAAGFSQKAAGVGGVAGGWFKVRKEGLEVGVQLLHTQFPRQLRGHRTQRHGKRLTITVDEENKPRGPPAALNFVYRTPRRLFLGPSERVWKQSVDARAVKFPAALAVNDGVNVLRRQRQP